MLRGLLALVLATLLTACFPPSDNDDVVGDGGSSPDGGVITDGGSSPDGGVTTDGGSSPDGGVITDGGSSPDGGVITDGGSSPDGGVTTDGGSSPDGGVTTDGGSSPDGGVITDGGSSPDGGVTTDGGSSPDGGAPGFTWPASSLDYVPHDLRYLDTLTIPPDDGSGGETCCRDFGAASGNPGAIDNRWAGLMRNLEGLVGFSLQGDLDDHISVGDLVLLLDTLDPAVAADPRIVARFDGQLDGVDAATAAAGQGWFLVSRSANFVGTTGEPLEFHEGTLVSNALDVAGPSFTLHLPLIGADLSYRIHDAQLTATDDTGSYLQGELSGYIDMAEFFGSLNDFLLSAQCSCLGLSAPVYTPDGNGGFSGNCAQDVSACTDPSTEACTQFGGSTCGILPVLITGDLDLDGDPGTQEGMSIGFQWTAVPTQGSTFTP